jgi:hypothetical protein
MVTSPKKELVETKTASNNNSAVDKANEVI